MKKNFLFSVGAVCLGIFLFAISTQADNSGTLLPNGDGSYQQWTPSTGSSHYNLVDEATCNGNTDYVSTTTVGKRDSYQVDLSSIPNGSQISQIDITPCVSKNSSGGSNSTVKVFYRYNGSDSSDSAGYSLSGTTPTDQSAASYTSLSLTKGATSTLEIGAVLSAGNKGAKLSRIAVSVTYTAPPAAPSNLSGSKFSNGTSTAVSLTWTDNSSNESGFKLEDSLDGVNYLVWQILPANATSTNDYYPLTGTNHYRIKAYNATGDSAYSNVLNITIP